MNFTATRIVRQNRARWYENVRGDGMNVDETRADVKTGRGWRGTSSGTRPHVVFSCRGALHAPFSLPMPCRRCVQRGRTQCAPTGIGLCILGPDRGSSNRTGIFWDMTAGRPTQEHGSKHGKTRRARNISVCQVRHAVSLRFYGRENCSRATFQPSIRDRNKAIAFGSW
jgi:hypothetical protein